MFRHAGVWLLVVGALYLPACAQEDAADSPDEVPETVRPANDEAPSARVAELIALIRSSPRDEGSEAEIGERIGALDRAEKHRLADALAADDDPGVAQLRSAVLFELGEDGEAAAILAAQVVDGVDLGGLFWGWMHAEDPSLATRRYVAISRALLTRYPNLGDAERRRADLVLCEESFGGSLDPCTPEEVAKRLDRLEDSHFRTEGAES